MRVLVAGRNAKVLAQVAGTFADDLTMATATTKAAALALLDHTEFDLVVACETLGDGSGLEVLSQVAVNTPNTLRIFAARPATLSMLKGELGFFGLFRTLPYPINFRTLWAAINLARGCLGYRDSDAAVQAPAQGSAPPRSIRHVVLDGDLDATQPLPIMPNDGSSNIAMHQARSGRKPVAPTGNGAAGEGTSNLQAVTGQVTARQGAARQTGAPSAHPPTGAKSSGGTRASHIVATEAVLPTATGRVTQATRATSPDRIPETAAFQRARARREAMLRQEPSVTTESLAELAHLSLKRKPTYEGRPPSATRRRTALFVGSGVFAALAATMLTFFMLGSSNSIGKPSLPIVASMNQPVPHKVLPWQPAAPDTADVAPNTIIPADPPATATEADMQVEAEAASEQFGIEPGAPPPPPPMSPPGPSEPPQYDANGMPVEE